MRGPSCTRTPGPSWAPWRGVITGLLVGVMLVVGCGKRKPGTEAPADTSEAVAGEPDMGEPEAGGHFAGDPLSRYELELEGHEDELLAAGLSLPAAVEAARTDRGKTSVAATVDEGNPPGPRCERICRLATNICELRDHICTLADDHRGEPRYTRSCERATLDCERATEACEGCDD
jgi:hypothetical protein